jgi:hypothetical protein
MMIAWGYGCVSSKYWKEEDKRVRERERGREEGHEPRLYTLISPTLAASSRTFGKTPGTSDERWLRPERVWEG